LVYTNYYEMIFNCEFELQKYPFDNQNVEIGVSIFVIIYKRGSQPGERWQHVGQEPQTRGPGATCGQRESPMQPSINFSKQETMILYFV
jgi:hypothetical protein